MEESQVESVKMPWGSRKRIAQVVNKSPAYVTMVLQGKHFNKDILREAAEILRGNKEELNKLSEYIEQQK